MMIPEIEIGWRKFAGASELVFHDPFMTSCAPKRRVSRILSRKCRATWTDAAATDVFRLSMPDPRCGKKREHHEDHLGV
jgi:hypothetical protein